MEADAVEEENQRISLTFHISQRKNRIIGDSILNSKGLTGRSAEATPTDESAPVTPRSAAGSETRSSASRYSRVLEAEVGEEGQ